MKIAIVNTFAYRPHVEHLVWLGDALSSQGHEILYYGCAGGRRVSCNTKLFKDSTPSVVNCLMCKQFGLGAFGKDIKYLSADNREVALLSEDLANSSLYTNLRVETPDEIATVKSDSRFGSLLMSASSIAESFSIEIDKNRFDLVIGFNGRMDLMRAIRLSTTNHNLPFVSVERPWFGRGLLCIPNEGPLNFAGIDKLWSRSRFCALSRNDALKAIQPMVKRRLKINNAEFRVFGKENNSCEIPDGWNNKKSRYLYLPSSRMEALTEIDQEDVIWSHPLDALQKLIASGEIEKDQILVRFHPIWSQELNGHPPAKETMRYYKYRCAEIGVNYIDSDSTISTEVLIEESDVIILNGSSAFWEVGLLGKPIISLVKSWYDPFNLTYKLYSMTSFTGLKPFIEEFNHEESRRFFLRALYLFQFSFTQFTESVFHKTSFEVYFKTASHIEIRKFLDFVLKGDLNGNSSGDYTDVFEDEILNDYKAQNFTSMLINEDFENAYRLTPKNTIKKWLHQKV